MIDPKGLKEKIYGRVNVAGDIGALSFANAPCIWHRTVSQGGKVSFRTNVRNLYAGATLQIAPQD